MKDLIGKKVIENFRNLSQIGKIAVVSIITLLLLAILLIVGLVTKTSSVSLPNKSSFAPVDEYAQLDDLFNSLNSDSLTPDDISDYALGLSDKPVINNTDPDLNNALNQADGLFSNPTDNSSTQDLSALQGN